MINAWRAAAPEKAAGQFNARAVVYRVTPYAAQRGLPVLAVACGGLVGLVDMNRG